MSHSTESVQGYSGTGVQWYRVQCSGTFEMGTSERFYILFNEYVE